VILSSAAGGGLIMAHYRDFAALKAATPYMVSAKYETAPMASRGGVIRLHSAFPARNRNNKFRHDISSTAFHR
jgi:hypothetical protein